MLKRITKITLMLVLLSALLIAGAAVMFSRAGHHVERIEEIISNAVEQPVEIGAIKTAWQGFNPQLLINDLKIRGEGGQANLSFSSLAMVIDWRSLWTLKPVVDDFVINELYLRIQSMSGGGLMVAGVPLSQREDSGSAREMLAWLLQHKAASCYRGQVDWVRINGDVHNYRDITVAYTNQDNERLLSAISDSYKGGLQFKASSSGDILSHDNWNAALEIFGNEGQQLLKPEDLSLRVVDGQGELRLSQMRFQKLRDIMQLVGLGKSINWVVQSNLEGLLSNISFYFKGAFLDFEDWRIQANVRDLAFQSTGDTPALNQLSGDLSIDGNGGVFEFAADKAEFSWPRWLKSSFAIDHADGLLTWEYHDREQVKFHLKQGRFQDDAVQIENLTAKLDLQQVKQGINTVGQIFDWNILNNLAYQDGQLVDKRAESPLTQPLFLDASADFNVVDVNKVVRYFPKAVAGSFSRWWENGMLEGQVTQGKFSYQGALTKQALINGQAIMKAHGNIENLYLDYAYQDEWPAVNRASGRLEIENDKIDIFPEQAYLEQDAISKASVKLRHLYERKRYIEIAGHIDTGIKQTTDFLLFGPLTRGTSINKKTFPLTFNQGDVSADMLIHVPLTNVSDAEVRGSAEVSNALITLPEGVKVEQISGKVNFTEQSVNAEKVTAKFLGSAATADVVTIQQGKPPTVKIIANGTGDIKKITPWLGAHVTSLMQGKTKWQGEIVIDEEEIVVDATSDLQGISLDVPQPLRKTTNSKRPFSLQLKTGSNTRPMLRFNLGENLVGEFKGENNKSTSFLGYGVIAYHDKKQIIRNNKPGIHIHADMKQADLDLWLDKIVEIAELQLPASAAADTSFLDAMRSIELQVDKPVLFDRPYQAISMSALSMDGAHWIGKVKGEQINGTLQAEPRETPGRYRFDLSKFVLPKALDAGQEPAPIDSSLQPASFPHLELNVNQFVLEERDLGRLELIGQPIANEWSLEKFNLTRRHITTVASGQWRNTKSVGSRSSFTLETKFNEAGNVLGDMAFVGVMKKGKGRLTADIHWRGAPHEFDFSRLDGEFDIKVKDGELLQVEPGSGKLFGLLNANAIFRRMTLDFSDLFAKGLIFDQIRFNGYLAEGEAIYKEAYIYSPAVFIQMQGKVDLDEELVDLEIHAAPELAGNITLLSALANPAAGAVLFITQKIFPNGLTSPNMRSYQLRGPWKSAELLLMEGGKVVQQATSEGRQEELQKAEQNKSKSGSTQ